MTILHADRTKSPYFRCYALRAFLNIMAPSFKFCSISLRTSIGIHRKRLLLRCIHHFKSDLIYSMDHMRISGTEPSSVILSQTKSHDAIYRMTIKAVHAFFLDKFCLFVNEICRRLNSKPETQFE